MLCTYVNERKWKKKKNPLRDSQKKLHFSLFNYAVEWHRLKSHEIPMADSK